MDEKRVSKWLTAYGDAWQSYDPATIGDLFSEDVSYRYHPYDEPVRGRVAVVASWLEERDAEGTYKGAYEPLVVAGDTAIATGTSTYEDGDDARIYYNCFILRFDNDGRCSEFTEWYMRRPDPKG